MKEAVYHTVLESEKVAFTNHVNEVLKNDPDVAKRLPIPHKDIFEAVSDGVILWYVLQYAVNWSTQPLKAKSYLYRQLLSI